MLGISGPAFQAQVALNKAIIADICRKENSFLQITNLNYSMISTTDEFFFAECRRFSK
jgi:hypothetical protein